jgi:thiol-disulfide isomerase/thioredoxin
MVGALLMPAHRPSLEILRGAARAILLAGAACLSACGGAPKAPSNAQTVIVSLTRIDCADCGEQIVSDLRERPGVYSATFDKRKAEIAVVASPSFDVFTTVKQLAASQGFEAVLGAGKGRYHLQGPAFPVGSDTQVIENDGADLPDLAPVLGAGKVTVVDFYAAWCRPCVLIDQHMVDVVFKGHPDVAFRKLDVGDWDSPLAHRYLRNVGALPYVVVYGKTGVRLRAIAGPDLGALDAAIVEGLAAPP